MKDIFVREDIAKPENRINLAIFHLQMNESFHQWFCSKLGIPISSLIYPTKNLSGDRPDLAVKNDGVLLGYIEVELGDENQPQLNAYRKKYQTDNCKVYSITGKSYHRSDLSLEEIGAFLTEKIMNATLSQTYLSMLYLRELIDTYSGDTSSNTRSAVSSEVLNTPFVSRLLEALKNYAPEPHQRRAEPGKYYCDTVGEKGFSLRVYSHRSSVSTKSLSLLAISNGRDGIIFQSAYKYRKYLSHKNPADIERFISFIHGTLGAPINTLPENSRCEIAISTVAKNLDGLIEVIIPIF